MSEAEQSTSITFRPINSDDLAEVSALAIESKASWGYPPEEMQIFTEELTMTDSYLNSVAEAQVAVRDNRFVGYYTLCVHGDDTGVIELDSLFVSASHLRKGIGRQLLSAALESARSRGAEILQLIADPNAEGFYQQLGAVKVGDHLSSIAGRTIPVMEFKLSPPGS